MINELVAWLDEGIQSARKFEKDAISIRKWDEARRWCAVADTYTAVKQWITANSTDAAENEAES